MQSYIVTNKTEAVFVLCAMYFLSESTQLLCSVFELTKWGGLYEIIAKSSVFGLDAIIQ